MAQAQADVMYHRARCSIGYAFKSNFEKHAYEILSQDDVQALIDNLAEQVQA